MNATCKRCPNPATKMLNFKMVAMKDGVGNPERMIRNGAKMCESCMALAVAGLEKDGISPAATLLFAQQLGKIKYALVISEPIIYEVVDVNWEPTEAMQDVQPGTICAFPGCRSLACGQLVIEIPVTWNDPKGGTFTERAVGQCNPTCVEHTPHDLSQYPDQLAAMLKQITEYGGTPSVEGITLELKPLDWKPNMEGRVNIPIVKSFLDSAGEVAQRMVQRHENN